MKTNVTTEDKISLLRFASKTTPYYDKRVYKLYAYSVSLLMKVKCGEADCADTDIAITDLEYLASNFKSMAEKYDNYKAVINQLARNA
jgi:hypothetical protein